VARKKKADTVQPVMSFRCKPMPEDWLIDRCWEGPYTLSQAAKRLRDNGYTDIAKLVAEWRRRFRQHGSRLYPKPAPPRTYTKKELEQPLFSHGKKTYTYGEWLGVTGKGKLLRDLLARERTN
jgi:hypothetical protein